MLLSEIRTINVLENIKKYNIDVSQYEDIASIRKAIRKVKVIRKIKKILERQRPIEGVVVQAIL